MSLSNLPDDIQAEILMKLPVDSILACKYLCKLWFTLISSPDFIKNHLHLTTQRNNNFRLMFSHWSKRPDGAEPVISSIEYASILPLSLSCQRDGYVPMDYPLNLFRYEDVKAARLLGSCNGLICLKIVTYGCNIIYIWNPSTKEYKRVPECDVSSSNNYGFKYGFGFDKTINGYKVVRIPFGNDGMCSDIQVYTLGLNSWHNVQTITYWINWQRKYWQWKFLLASLLFNGAVHWLGFTTEGTSSDFIVSFELSNERLTQFPFPKEHRKDWKGNGELYKSVGVLGDRICLNIGYSDYSALGDCIDIWVMQDYGVQESWTKRFTITQLEIRHLPCKPICSLEDGQILLDTRSDLILYDPNSGKVRKAIPSDDHMNKDVEIYVESLASVNSNTYARR